jgi:hypothetical protein
MSGADDPRRVRRPQQPPAWLVPLVGLFALLVPLPVVTPLEDEPGDAVVMLPVPRPLGDVVLLVVPDAPHGSPVIGLVRDEGEDEDPVVPGPDEPGANPGLVVEDELGAAGPGAIGVPPKLVPPVAPVPPAPDVPPELPTPPDVPAAPPPAAPPLAPPPDPPPL